MNPFLESAIFVVNLGISMFISSRWWKLLGKGRMFSRPLWKYPLFRPIHDPFTGTVYGFKTRYWQIIVVSVACMIVAVTTEHHMLAVQSTTLTVLYLDDCLTGDDEKWKRFKDKVRNKIKWRMHVPRPAIEAG